MVEGIKPGQADQFRAPVSVSTSRYSSLPLNFASTLKSVTPISRFAPLMTRGSRWIAGFNRRRERP